MELKLPTTTTRFSYEPLSGSIARSRLLADDVDTGMVLDGHILDAQYHCVAGELLFATDDTPYEEILHIRLITSEFLVVDAVDLGHIQTAGILRNLQVIGVEAFGFSFFGNDFWHLTIEEQFKLRWDLRPFASVSYPAGRMKPHCLNLVRSDGTRSTPPRTDRAPSPKS